MKGLIDFSYFALGFLLMYGLTEVALFLMEG